MIRVLARALRRWVVPPSTGQHWDLLDGLRGVAILMVVAGHALYANPSGPLWTQRVSLFFQSGFLGVPVFFVLSGFLISLPFFKARARSPESWWVPGYAIRRLLKVGPPFYLTIVILGVYYIWRYHESRYVVTGLQWAVGIPHVIYVPHHFNGSFWSLWVELGFYAMLPLLFWLLRGRGVMATALVIGCVLLVGPVITRSLDSPGAGADPLYVLYLRGRFPNSLTNFAWGVLFAGWYVANHGKPRSERWSGIAGYAGMALLLITMWARAAAMSSGRDSERLTTELFVPLAGIASLLMLCFLFAPSSAGARLLSGPGLRYIGLVSYEWFLLHQPALIEARAWAGSAGGRFWTYALIVGVPILATLVLASFLYHSFSMPIIRVGRRWWEQRHRKEAVEQKQKA